MKNLKILLSILTLSIVLTSCYVTRTTVGNGPIGKDTNAIQYSKSKQFYLFWGLVPIGQKQPDTPKDGNCQIKTSLKIGDAVIYGLTGGILSAQTTQVIIKK